MSEAQAVVDGVAGVATETGTLVISELDNLMNVMKDFNMFLKMVLLKK